MKVEKQFNNTFLQDFMGVTAGAQAHLSAHMYQSKAAHSRHDQVNGALLWEVASNQPSYYLKWNEIQIFQQHAEQIAHCLNKPVILFDLGPGAASSVQMKTVPLLKALSLQGLAGYVAVDLEMSYLQEAASLVNAIFPTLPTQGLEIDFMKSLQQLPPVANPVILFTGSTIGNRVEKNGMSFLDNIKMFLNGIRL